MLTYIKNPYISPVEGITNTETGWKVTRDLAGTDIVEETPLSPDTINMYESDLSVPVGTSVYIWYKLKLSNDEVKEYVGPYEYVSRDSNITSDIKPVTRVKTPSISYDKDSIAKGDNLLVLTSSDFNGDSLDGHLASTWILKTTDEKIIYYKLMSTDDKYSITLNRQSLGLNRYDKIKVYLKHHSSNGSVSETYSTTIDLSLYPFTFIGEQSINSKLLYQFRLNPVLQSNHNIDMIEVLHNTNLVMTMKYNEDNIYSIPPYTLNPNRVYTIRVYVLDRENNKYPEYLDVELTTIHDISSEIPTDMTYPTELIDNTVNYIASDKWFIGKTINNKFMVYDNIISRFKLLEINKLDGTLGLSKQLIGFTSYINSADFRIFNLSTNRFLVVSKIGNNISIVFGMINDNLLVRDLTRPVILIPIGNASSHDLFKTSTLSEDEKTLYIVYKNTTSIKFVSINLVTGAETLLATPPDLLFASYSLGMYSIASIGDDKIIFFNTVNKSWSIYNIREAIWIKMGLYPSYLTTIFKIVVLADRTVLLLTNDTGKVVRINRNLSITEFDSSAGLQNYNILALDSTGILYGYSKTNMKAFTYKPE